MGVIKRLFVSEENKALKQILNKPILKKGYYCIETKVPGCEAAFELKDNEFTMKFIFSKQDPGNKNSPYACVEVKYNEELEYIKNNSRIRKLDEKLLANLKYRYYRLLQSYQSDQETRYRQFIKELIDEKYEIEEKTIVSDGFELGKEFKLITNHGIDLILTKKSGIPIIKVKDSEEMYIRNLVFSLEANTFTSSKLRKINIPAGEKENLMLYLKEFLESLGNSHLFFTEEETMLEKVNGS